VHSIDFMQGKTTGIILHSTKYTDSATIVTVYTRLFGRVSYLIYGVNKKKSIGRAGLLLPLSIIDIEVKHTPGKSIQHIKEIRMEHQFTGIPFDPIKNSVALFICEILFKTLKQVEPDENMFLFLENSILQLDCGYEGIQNFHLVFLLKLTRYLGFEPNVEESGKYFDLMNGVFLKEKPFHVHFLLPDVALQFSTLLQIDYTNMSNLILTRESRSILLKSIVEYYRLHIPEFNNLNSFLVLQSLFD
jgi:DNA repair protein RecO (recombination protein O)